MAGKSVIDILSVGDSITETAKQTSSLTPTELNRWYMGMFVKSAMILCGLLLSFICFLWYEVGNARSEYATAASEFTSSIKELNILLGKREDALAQVASKLDMMNITMKILESKMDRIELNLFLG